MQRAKLWLVMLAAVMAAVALAEEPADKSAAPADHKEVRDNGPAKRKPILPWRKLDSLTDEQMDRIHEIHKTALEQIRAIREKEREDMLAVLTPEQRAELEAAIEKEKADRKAKQAARKAQKEDDEDEGKDDNDRGRGERGDNDDHEDDDAAGGDQPAAPAQP